MDENYTHPTDELLAEVYRNVKMGSESVSDIIPKIEDRRFLSDMTAELETYGKYAKEAEEQMIMRSVKPKELQLHKKLGAKMGIAMNTMMDSSTSHLAEMVIKGNHMGADQLDEIITKCERAGCDGAAAGLAKKVVSYERAEAEKLRQYL